MPQSTMTEAKDVNNDSRLPPALPRSPLPEEPSAGNAPQKLGGMPAWMPITLIAVTSAALVVPLVLLRRAQNATTAPVAATRLHASGSAPPPRRSIRVLQGQTNTALPTTPASIIQPNPNAAPPRRIPLNTSTSQPTTRLTPPPPSTASASAPLIPTEDDVSAAKSEGEEAEAEVDVLMGAKAFGYATLMVGVGAMFTIWGIRTALGVDTAEEFGQRMRQILRREMPSLAAGLYGDVPASEAPSSPLGGSVTEPGDAWTWPAAEERLTATFERDGFEAWVKHAEQELQSESAIEKRKRDALVAPSRRA